MLQKVIKKLFGFLLGYSELMLGSGSQGFLGFIGLAKEVTWGTPVPATDYTDAFSENLATTIDRFDLKNLSGTFAEPDDAIGVSHVQGEIQCSAGPNILGLMLKSTFNTVPASGPLNATTVLSGFLYRQAFTTTLSEFSPEAASQPYTLEIFRDVTSSFQYSGCIVNRLSLQLQPNSPLRITASFIGKRELLIAKSSVTFPGSPLAPFAYDTCSLSIDGVASARWESITINIDNQLNGIPALNASALIARVRRSAAQIVTLQGTIDFTDITEYNDFLNQSERAIKMTMTKPASFQFVIDMPRMVYTSFPLGIPSKDRLVVSFEGKARFLTSSNTAIACILTTTRSNW